MNNQHKDFTRRAFLRLLGLTGVGATLASCGGKPANPPVPTALAQATATTVKETAVPTISSGGEPVPTATMGREPTPAPTKGEAYLAVARGQDPASMTTAALAALGGIERFVKKGADVIVKPNICTNYHTYEYATTTNPEVVATLVRLCLGAGAKRVRVMDFPFGGTAKSAYTKSGIADAVAAAGGEMEIMNTAKFKKIDLPKGQNMKSWVIYEDILSADVWINVPIAKHHSLARLTLGGKNLLGLIQNREAIHQKMGGRVADLVAFMPPTLTVVDAVRILTDHGPTGGSLDDVKLTNTVIASHDIVAADAFAATLFGLTGHDIGYIKAAADLGLGTLDLISIKVAEVTA